MLFNKTMRALADVNRRKILTMLKKKELSAGEIAQGFSITKPSLSHHLAILKSADLLSSRRQGQNIIYSLNLSVFEEAAKKIAGYFKAGK